MPKKNGEKFLCFLPKVEKSKSGKPVAQQNLSSMIVESEMHMKLKTPDELLEVLKERCFIRVKFSTTLNQTDELSLIVINVFLISSSTGDSVTLVSICFSAFFL